MSHCGSNLWFPIATKEYWFWRGQSKAYSSFQMAQWFQRRIISNILPMIQSYVKLGHAELLELSVHFQIWCYLKPVKVAILDFQSMKHFRWSHKEHFYLKKILSLMLYLRIFEISSNQKAHWPCRHEEFEMKWK